MVPRPNSAAAPSSKSSNSTSTKKRAHPLEFHYLTLFPESFSGILNSSLIGRAIAAGLIKAETHQLRDFAHDKHRSVDDTPYGGGAGMLLKADVLFEAWKSIVPRKSKKTRTLLMSPQGPRFTQARARELVHDYDKLVLICGHYEGLDERFIAECVDEEISVGDYVLTGGELPAMILTDAMARLIPGVVGNPESVSDDSLENGLLKSPQYTRPRVWREQEVPAVLMSGNHKEIAKWRQKESEERTARKRPDLWAEYELSRKPRR